MTKESPKEESPMKHVFPLTLMSLIAAGLLTATVFAQPGGPMGKGPGPGGKGPWLERAAKELNLTEEQKSALKDLALKTRKANIDVEAKMKIARLDLMNLLSQPTPDSKAVDAKVTEISKYRTDIMRNRIDLVLGAKKLLTPEQQKKAQELRFFRWRGEGEPMPHPRHFRRPHRPGWGWGFDGDEM